MMAQFFPCGTKAHDHSGDAGDGGTFDAANLTSAAATDGHVLTADGSGGAAWAAASGGGASLAFDGATITVGTFDAENEWWPVTLVLTLSGAPIDTSPLFMVYMTNPTSGMVTSSGNALLASIDDAMNIGLSLLDSTADDTAFWWRYVAGDPNIKVECPAGWVKLNVVLPSGLVVQSANIGYAPE